MSGGDQLDMGRLSLNESQHAGPTNNGFPGRTTYIPPHLRSRGGGGGGHGPSVANGPPAANGPGGNMMNGASGMNNSQWGNNQGG